MYYFPTARTGNLSCCSTIRVRLYIENLRSCDNSESWFRFLRLAQFNQSNIQGIGAKDSAQAWAQSPKIQSFLRVSHNVYLSFWNFNNTNFYFQKSCYRDFGNGTVTYYDIPYVGIYSQFTDITVSRRSPIKGVRPSSYATGVPNSQAGVIISPAHTQFSEFLFIFNLCYFCQRFSTLHYLLPNFFVKLQCSVLKNFI